MSRYRMLASTCVDGDCPSVLIDDATDDVIVRGPDDGDLTRERDLRFTRAEWMFLRGIPVG